MHSPTKLTVDCPRTKFRPCLNPRRLLKPDSARFIKTTADSSRGNRLILFLSAVCTLAQLLLSQMGWQLKPTVDDHTVVERNTASG